MRGMHEIKMFFFFSSLDCVCRWSWKWL